MRNNRSNQSTATKSSDLIAPGTRNVPKKVSRAKLSNLFKTIHHGLREVKPSEAQFYSSILIHQSLMPEKPDNDEEFIANVVGKVMDQTIFISQLYEAWHEALASNRCLRKEVGHE